jgi:hypothetical protein
MSMMNNPLETVKEKKGERRRRRRRRTVWLIPFEKDTREIGRKKDNHGHTYRHTHNISVSKSPYPTMSSSCRDPLYSRP